MRSCDALDPLVTPYVDGELRDEDRRAVEAHLRACPPCHSRVAAERAVHELICDRKTELNAVHAPEPLRAACAELARSKASRDDGALPDARVVRELQLSDPRSSPDAARRLGHRAPS